MHLYPHEIRHHITAWKNKISRDYRETIIAHSNIAYGGF